MIIADFIRHLLPEMLEAYCKYKEINFTIPKNKKPQDIASSFIKHIEEQLSSNNKGSIELDFQDMKEIANEKGSLLLLEEKNDIFSGVPKELQGEMSPYDKAMWSFIHEPDVFCQVALEYTVENTTGWSAYQIKTPTNSDIKSKKDKVAIEVGQYLQKHEGRGELCTTEYYEKDDYICFVVYPEDFMSRDISYEGKTLNKRSSRRPVFKIYFLYLPELNRIYIKSKKIRSKAKKLNLAKIFVYEVFGQILQQENCIEYNLDILKEKIQKGDYLFPYPPEDEIFGIKVTSLRLAFTGLSRMMTLDEDKIGSDGLTDIAQWQEKLGIKNTNYKILQVKIRIKFKPKIKRQRGDVTATITPYSCNLGLKLFERKASRYLIDWGIDILAQK